jgi:hypothetical protein
MFEGTGVNFSADSVLWYDKPLYPYKGLRANPNLSRDFEISAEGGIDSDLKRDLVGDWRDTVKEAGVSFAETAKSLVSKGGK